MSDKDVPLCVDLDGTLVYGDMSLKSFVQYVRFNPLKILQVLWWHRKGRAYTKYRLYRHFRLDLSTLKFIEETIKFLNEEKAKGRKLYLCTGSNVLLAKKIAEHVGIFDGVFGTYIKKNFVGHNKALVLIKKFGDGCFDYVGNAAVDLKVWNHARKVIVVNASNRVQKQALENFGNDRVRILKNV